MTSQRCIWSGRSDPGTRPVPLKPGEHYQEKTYWVCPAHEAQLQDYHRWESKRTPLFLGLLGLAIFGGLLLALFERVPGVALLLAALGLVVLGFPFATSQTIQLLGVQRSIWLVRSAGVLIFGLGLYGLLRAIHGA